MDDAGILYDVAIIGGGLAGLTLSIQCADAGFKTILFEKETYPFHKVCGEYISMESYPFLQRLGLQLEQFDLPKINHLQVSDVKGNLYDFFLPSGGFGISRYALDHSLSVLAVTKGVTLLQSARVNDTGFKNDAFFISTNGGNYKAKVAAGTFGKRSNLDIKWKRSFVTQKPGKLANWIGVKYHIRFPYPKANIALHNFRDGYCGISNIEKDQCCFCYLTRAANLKLNHNSVEMMEEEILKQNPFLKTIFNQATFLYKEPLTISQVSFARKTQVENHILMIGDAAGLITPLCGNGMSMAMHAGKIAFENIQKFLQHEISRDQMELQYRTEWKIQFSKRLLIGRMVQKLFGNNRSTTLFLKIMHKLPWLTKQLIESTHGKPF